MGPFQQAQGYLGSAGGGVPNFSMGQNSLYAQQALQNSLLGLNRQRSNLGFQFGQQQFNTEHDPGLLGGLSALVNLGGAANDIFGYAKTRDLMNQTPGMVAQNSGLPGMPSYGMPYWMAGARMPGGG